MLKRSSKLFIEITGAIVAGLIVIAVLLGLRLSAGPWQVNFLNRYMESSLSSLQIGMRMHIERSQLEWDDELHSPTLRLQSLQAFDADNRLLATFPDLAVGISLRGLLFGTVAPSRLTIIEPSITVVRQPDGKFAFANMSSEGAENNTAAGTEELLQKILASLSGKEQSGTALDYLRFAEIRHGELLLDDQKNQVSFWMPRIDISLSRDRKGLFGKADLQIELNEKTTELKGSLEWPKGSDSILLTSAFNNIDVTNVVELLPELHEFGFLRTPLSGQLRITAAPDATFQSVKLIAEGKQGFIVRPDLWAQPVPIQKWNMDVEYDNTGNLLIHEAKADFGSMTASVQGSIKTVQGRHNLEFNAAVEKLQLADLNGYWPYGMAQNARDWVVPNIQRGLVQTATAKIVAHASNDDLSDLEIESLIGDMQFSDAMVDYFNPLPKADGISGSVQFDQNDLVVKTQGGQANGVKLGEGMVTIHGLSAKDQTIEIAIDASGNLTNALQIIDHEPLQLPSKRDIKPASVRGEFQSKLEFKFPLEKDLLLDDLDIKVEAEAAKVHMDQAFQGFPLSRANLKLHVTQNDMEVSGDGFVAGLPLSVLWKENFRDAGDKPRSQYIVKADMPEIGAEILHLPRPIPITGTADVDVDYRIYAQSQSRLSIKADLQNNAIAIPQANWWKDIGTPATAQMDIIFVHDSVSRIPNFIITGKDIKISGEADFDDKQDLTRLDIKQLQTANNNAQAIIKREAPNSYAVNAWGSKFDAAHLYKQRSAGESQENYAIDMNFATLSLGGKSDFRNVKSRMVLRAGEFESLRLDADTIGENNAATPLVVLITPMANGRKLAAKSDDAGAVLRVLDTMEEMNGGKLSVDGMYDDANPSKLTAGITITDFSMRNASILVQLLNLSSLPGILDNLTGQGINFQKFSSTIEMQKDLIKVKNARANGASIGLRTTGTMDLKNRYYDLNGTLVPANAINRVISEIPLIGGILTMGGEQPLFAFNFTIKGPLGNPRVAVNPLSALTPGILREVFDNKAE